MAETVRGLTVEISADATKFKNEMKAIRSEAKSSQAELNALQKSLELEFDADKFAKAQKIAQDALDQNAAAAETLRKRLEYLEQSGNIDTSEYRKLQTELAQTELKGQQLQVQLEKIKNLKYEDLAKQIDKVSDAAKSATSALTPLSAAAAAALTSLAALGLSAVSTADEVATLAVQYDTTATAIQKFNYVALQTDVDAEKLYKGLVKVRAGIADIASGTTSSASTALQQLGIDFDSFDGTEDQFYAIIAALSDMEDQTEMVALANDIFGDTLANNLLPMIYAGSDAIEEYCAEYEELGALTDEQVEKLAEFDNVMNKIKTQLSNVAAQIGSALLPVMQAFATFISESVVPKLQKLAEWFNSLSESQLMFMVKALLVVAALAPLALAISKVTSAISGIIKIIPKLMSGLSTLAAHPIILIIAAVVALLVVLYTQCETFRENINNLISTLSSALQPVLELLSGLLQTIMDLLTPLLDTLGEILGTVINLVVTALQPFFDILSVLFELLQPLLSVALIPLQLALSALQVPLQALGTLLGWLSPLFTVFGNVVTAVFKGVVTVLNFILEFIEDVVNGVIKIINGLIKGINTALGWLGVNIGYISEVSLKIDTSSLDSIDDLTASLDTTAPDTSTDSSGTVYDSGTTATSGDTYNYDNSTTNTTQNVTVTIQNYAAEVDVDEMVRQINVKLAEAM